MNNNTKIELLLKKIWSPPMSQSIVNTSVSTKLYTSLDEKIPDASLKIETVYHKDQIDNILQWSQSIIEDAGVQIFPFMQTTAGNEWFCIGYSEAEFGWVYYYSFDFGHCLLEKSLDEFLSKNAITEK